MPASAAAEGPWGKAVDGIACQLTVPGSLCVGQAFRAIVEVKNASDKPMRVLDMLDPMFAKVARIDITGPDGPVKISGSADRQFGATEWKLLKPGDTLRWEIADLRVCFWGPGAKLGAAGKFSLTYALMGTAPGTPVGDEPCWTGTCVSNVATVQVDEPTAEDLTVHEWGVFTICSDLEFANAGMKAEWASMPEAFYRQFPKAAPQDVGPVPSRMRKPIIYFYSQRGGLHLDVKVGFNDGAPVIWWPYASTAVKPWDGASIGHTLGWSLWLGDKYLTNTQMVNAKTDSPWQTAKLFDLPKVCWVKDARIEGPALVTVAASVPEGNGYNSSHFETEKFVYYDGLTPAPHYLSLADAPGELPAGQGGPVALRNDAKFAIEKILLIDRRNAAKNSPGHWALIEKLAPEEKVKAVFQDLPAGDKPGAASLALGELLLARGLTKNELAGLLSIWQEEFFERSGLTALYVLPQAEYDRLLPLEIYPKPGKIVRVGIVQQPHMEGLEAIRKQAAQLVAQLGDNNYNKREQATKALREFGVEIVPVLRQALSAATDLEVKTRLEKLLNAIDASEYLKPAAAPQPPPSNRFGHGDN
jgi:hypothetical protein